MFKDTKQQKEELRKQYRNIRKDVNKSYSSYAANSLINLFNKNLSFIKGKTIAAYIPTDGEIDVIPLIRHLFHLNYLVAVPNKNKLLKFKELNKNLDKDIVPDTIITPIIAFDHHFNRLGFGGGWYDKIIKKLRPFGKIFIGVAYEKQYCKNLPTEIHDQKLDIVITEMCVRIKKKNYSRKSNRKRATYHSILKKIACLLRHIANIEVLKYSFFSCHQMGNI